MIRFCITAFRGGMKGFIYEKISLSDPVFDRICCGVAFCAAQVIYRMGKKYGGFPKRDQSTVCVVENIKEVMAIENTGQFRGVYHVLGGIISPMDGIGPGDLQIDSLVQRVANEEVKEIVLALSTTMEGDTTNFFIYRKLSPYNVKITVIARGVSIGDEIEYADEITLGRSIVNRTSFNDSIKI